MNPGFVARARKDEMYAASGHHGWCHAMYAVRESESIIPYKATERIWVQPGVGGFIRVPPLRCFAPLDRSYCR